MSTTSPAGDEVQLVADHVGATVAQLERRIHARFGDRGLTKAARDLGDLVDVGAEPGRSVPRPAAAHHRHSRAPSACTIVVATVVALAFSLREAVIDGLDNGSTGCPSSRASSTTSSSPPSRCCSCGRSPSGTSARTLLRLLHRLRSLAHVIDMHQLSKDPEQVSPTYTRTAQSVSHGLDAEQLHHYLDYCSEMLSLTAKTAALCAEHSSDPVVLNTVSTLETLTTELSNKIWQKISLLPRPETAR